MCPQNKNKGVSCQLLSTCLRVGLKTLANHQQTRVGKNWGWRGLAPSQGVWGMCPQNKNKGVSCQLLSTCLRVGLKTLANPQQTRVGKNWGWRGLAPSQGVWGTCPQNKNKGLAANFCQPASEWDSKPWRTLSKRGWAKTGGVGGLPPPRGFGGRAPKTKTRG